MGGAPRRGTEPELEHPAPCPPAASHNLTHLLRTAVPNTGHRVPTVPWAHPKAQRRLIGPLLQAASPWVRQPPDTHSCRATTSRVPDVTSEDPGVLGELWALPTSGPGGDGLPGMGLVIGGVIAVQIHPVVIWVDLGGGPGALWSHLIRGTSWRLEKTNVDVSSPSPPSGISHR